MRLKLLIILTAVPVVLSAQLAEQWIEGIRERSSVYAGLDTRHSFIESNYTEFLGIQVGLATDRFKTGIGFSWIIDPNREQIDLSNIENPGTYFMTLTHHYTFVECEYKALDRHPWTVTVPVRAGLGKIKESYWQIDSDHDFEYASGTRSFELAVIADYRFLKYFGAGIGIGYRLANVKEDSIRTNLNSPIYMARLNFYLGDLFKAITSD